VRLLDAFEALKSRAELYRTVSNVQVADPEKTLTDLTTSVEHLLRAR
jgi:hypothetical protein